MKLIPNGADGYGSTHVQANFDDFSWYDKNYIQFKSFFNPVIRQAADFEIDKSPRLTTMWYYYIFFKGAEVYQFHSSKDFMITEIDTPSTDEHIREVIEFSHKALIRNFENRRKEIPVFDSILPVSEEVIEETVPLLREVLLHPLG